MEKKIENGVEYFKCSHCGVWYVLELKNIAAVGDGGNGVYCPLCARELGIIECEIWSEFIKVNATLPNAVQLACMRRIACIIMG